MRADRGVGGVVTPRSLVFFLVFGPPPLGGWVVRPKAVLRVSRNLACLFHELCSRDSSVFYERLFQFFLRFFGARFCCRFSLVCYFFAYVFLLGGHFRMPCFRPLQAYRFHVAQPWSFHESGKRKLFFGRAASRLLMEFGWAHELVSLPCGKCVGCLVRRVSDWSLRCVYEAQFWDRSSFLTLTYRTAALPANRSLLKADHQKFFKRLRQRLKRDHGVGALKYYMCGEYGERKGRPHYHVVLYGWDFPDRVQVPNNPGARDSLFTSPLLESVWGNGDVRIGEVSSESAAYVARYTMKKLRGAKGKAFYEANAQVPPYTACSKGVGRSHFERFRDDHFPCDEAVDPSSMQVRPVPRYFDKLLEAVDAEAFAEVKAARVERAMEIDPAECTPARLAVREECLRAKLGLLMRKVERDHATADSRCRP